MDTSKHLDSLRRCMKPSLLFELLLSAALIGLYLLAGWWEEVMLLAAPVLIVVLLWRWIRFFVLRCRSRRNLEDAIALAGENALAEDFRTSRPLLLLASTGHLRMGQRFLYDLGNARILPIASFTRLILRDKVVVSTSSDKVKTVTRLYATAADNRPILLAMFDQHTSSVGDIVLHILMANPDCAFLYDVGNDVAVFGQETCAQLCLEHPEAGFIRQHDTEKRYYGLSRTLQEGFEAF